jgi:hypothetical protein
LEYPYHFKVLDFFFCARDDLSLIQQHFVIRLFIDVMNINMADDAVLSMMKWPAPCNLLYEAPHFRNRAVRPEIA